MDKLRIMIAGFPSPILLPRLSLAGLNGQKERISMTCTVEISHRSSMCGQDADCVLEAIICGVGL